MTETESVDQLWNQYASKVLKSGCRMDGHLTLEHLRKYEFQCIQDKEMLHLQ